MRIHPFLLDAIRYAREGNFSRCREMLYDFQSGSYDEDTQLDYAWRRLEQFEAMEQASTG